MAHSGGPTYCETLTDYALDGWLATNEPLNVITNFVTLGGAIAGWYYMRRRGVFSWGAVLLAVLAAATGIGSFAWHVTHDATLLPYDVIPGILFLFTFVFLWCYALAGRWAGYAGISAFLLGIIGIWQFTTDFGTGIIGVFGLTTVCAAILVTWTFRTRGAALGRWSATLIAVAAGAAVFRVIDLDACAILPTGTHFLWHTLLGIGVYMAIRLYIDIRHGV